MDHNDHLKFLRDAIPAAQHQVWGDFGCGWGAFTLALADLLPNGSHIHALDKNKRDLARLRETMRRFPQVTLTTHQADFTKPLHNLPMLDGIVMANSLHYVRRKRQADVLKNLLVFLKPQGHFILIEYNAERGNMAVPHPISERAWQTLVTDIGLEQARVLHTRPSRFMGEIYSAMSIKS